MNKHHRTRSSFCELDPQVSACARGKRERESGTLAQERIADSLQKCHGYAAGYAKALVCHHSYDALTPRNKREREGGERRDETRTTVVQISRLASALLVAYTCFINAILSLHAVYRARPHVRVFTIQCHLSRCTERVCLEEIPAYENHVEIQESKPLNCTYNSQHAFSCLPRACTRGFICFQEINLKSVD